MKSLLIVKDNGEHEGTGSLDDVEKQYMMARQKYMPEAQSHIVQDPRAGLLNLVRKSV